MASTVYNGTVSNSTLTHTNTSGKNERVLIYYLYCHSGSGFNASMQMGNLSWTIAGGANTSPQVWGLNLAINTYTSNASSMTNYMTVKSTDGTATGIHLPLEGYISDGQTFKLVSSNSTAAIQYNFVVITED